MLLLVFILVCYNSFRRLTTYEVMLSIISMGV